MLHWHECYSDYSPRLPAGASRDWMPMPYKEKDKRFIPIVEIRGFLTYNRVVKEVGL